MSIEAMSWAKHRKTGNSTTKLVLLMLADWANPGPKDGPRSLTADGRHFTWEGQEGIAECCEMSLSTVKRHQSVLKAQGFIRTEQRFSRSGNRLTDIIVLACDSYGPRPFPDVPEVVEETRCQDDPLSPPAEMTKCQIDLRSPVTLGPSVTGEPYRTVVLDSKNLSLSSADAATSVAGEEPEREEPAEDPTPKIDRAAVVEELVEVALTRHPHWNRSDTRKAIKAELFDGRALNVVVVAWQLFLEDPQTETPNRFRFPRQWWKTALGLVEPAKPKREPCLKGHPGGVEGNCAVCLSDAKGADGPTRVFVQAPKQRAAKPPWCGECDQRSRMVDLHGDNPRRCPTCSPRAAAPAGSA